MAEPIYKVVELVGTSEDSVSDAIDMAVQRASKTIRHLEWFEVTQIRGSISQGEVGRYQVTLKAGFALEE